MEDFLNLPTKEQFDVQNALFASIASHVGTGGITVSNWGDLQRLVRMGLHREMFTEGDQFLTTYNSVTYALDVIGINHDIPTDKRYKNSLTLQFHQCITDALFDATEALYCATTGLASGAHVFTLNALQYTFTTAQAVPAGGQVLVSTWQGTEGADQYVPTKVTTYAADRITAIETALSVTATTGVDTLTPINNHQRCRYGSNNYMESAIKQWLNSEATTFSWAPKTNFDRPPTGTPYTGAGFLKLLDPDLVGVLGAVDKQVARNTVTDGGGQDLFSDKVFLLSTKEVHGASEGAITGETAYPWYSSLAGAATNDPLAGRIKYLGGTARFWWLRAPHVTNSNYPRYVHTAGFVYSYYASSAYGVAPALCVV